MVAATVAFANVSNVTEGKMDKYEELLNEIEILKLRVEQLKDDKKVLTKALRAAVVQGGVMMDLYFTGRTPECQAVYDACVSAIETHGGR